MKGALFILTAAAALAISGGLLAYSAKQGPPSQDLGIDFTQPRHLVTRQMEIETAAMANRRPHEEPGRTERGAKVEFADPNASEPQFVLFIKTGCPCSVDAQPLFNRLARRFKEKVQFLGVIDGDQTVANGYATQFSAAFPVVADPKLQIVHDFQAKAAVYSALVARNGHIVKMWPGYSADMLRDMNRTISEEAAIKETPFDPQYAPVKKAAGCAFTASWN